MNCITEVHNDNSYVTILGLGSRTGALKLQVDDDGTTSKVGLGSMTGRWMFVEDFVDEVSTSKDDGATFLMFAGSKLCALDAPEYKPLNHVVDWERSQTAGRVRIQATYFVRRYAEGYEDATHDITSTEIQFQYWNRIIMQEELYHRPPRPAQLPETLAAAAEAQVSPEEDFLEYGVMDWNNDGVPMTESKAEPVPGESGTHLSSLLGSIDINVLWDKLAEHLVGLCGK